MHLAKDFCAEANGAVALRRGARVVRWTTEVLGVAREKLVGISTVLGLARYGLDKGTGVPLPLELSAKLEMRNLRLISSDCNVSSPMISLTSFLGGIEILFNRAFATTFEFESTTFEFELPCKIKLEFKWRPC